MKLLFFRSLSENVEPALASLKSFKHDPTDQSGLRCVGRFFHTIAGSADLAGEPVLATVGAMGESIVEHLCLDRYPDLQEATRLLGNALQCVRDTIEAHKTASVSPESVPSACGVATLNGQDESAGEELQSRARPMSVAPRKIQRRRRIPSLAPGSLTRPETSLVESPPELPEPEGGKVLIVDDDPFSAALIHSCLTSAGLISSYTCAPHQALEVIEHELPELIILDVVMPEMDGFDLCRRIRSHGALQFTPILFVTKRCDVETRVKGLEAGGNDYILKPFEPAELIARVRSHMTRHAALREMAIRDGLTRCYNHEYFRTRLNHEVARARRYQHKLCLAMLDADHFKRVNDTYGHPVGDAVLTHLANIITASVRTTDVVSRYGGEEFAILMLYAGAEEGHLVCERLRERVARYPFGVSAMAGEPLSMTVSIGIGVQGPNDTPSALLARADEALYEAKKTGRNRVLPVPRRLSASAS